MKIFKNMLAIELKMSFRNLVLVISTILLPLLLLFLFGGLYGNEPSRIFAEGAINMSTPAYLALSMAIIALTGMPMQLVSYKENKVLKRLKATPIQKWQILLPIFINYLLFFLAGMILLLLAANILYGVSITGNVFAFLFAMCLSVFSTFSLGFLLSCLCGNVKQITGIGFALLIPMIFLSGATMPTGAFPDSIGNISKVVPITYCVEFMQNTFLGKPFTDNITHIIVLSAIILVCMFLSLKLFKWE